MVENQKMSLRVDLRIVCGVLLLIIIGMLVVWKPWSPSSQRTISITGEAEIEAVPDKFTFYPTFEKNNSDNVALKTQLSDIANATVEELKKLGVAENDIELNASSYNYYYATEDDTQTGTVSLTITLKDKDLAQKVQDYLLTTEATGQISPYAEFSKEKQNELEAQARDKAVSDAREKATSSVKQLEAKLGKVIKIEDAQQQGFPWAYDTLETAVSDSGRGLTILPGKDTFTFSVTVTFEIR